MTVRKTGDWAKARKMLQSGPLKMRGAIATALHQEAHLLRKEIVQGITKQAPGSKAMKPLSPLTIAARKLAGADFAEQVPSGLAMLQPRSSWFGRRPVSTQ